MTTIKIELPLRDPRGCDGCPLLFASYSSKPKCDGFPTRQGARVIKKRVRDTWAPKRLDQCIASEVPE